MVKKKAKKKTTKKKVVKKTSKKIEETKCKSCSLLSWKFFIPLIVALIIVILLVIFLVVGVGATAIQLNDTIAVSYIGSLEDGTIFDTNVESVALENNLNGNYDFLQFTVGSGSLIKGFEEAVIGMHVGETKLVTFDAADAYGESKEELIVTLPKIQKLERYLNIDKDEFSELFKLEPELNKEFSVASFPWMLKVVDIVDNNVTVENLLVEGEPIQMEGVEWLSYVDSVTDEEIALYQDPQMGQKIILPSAQGPLQGVVVSSMEAEFILDLNHPLAGKDLTFEITVEELLEV